jgi:hypothetical protein
MCNVVSISGLCKNIGFCIALHVGKLFGNSSETRGGHHDGQSGSALSVGEDAFEKKSRGLGACRKGKDLVS